MRSSSRQPQPDRAAAHYTFDVPPGFSPIKSSSVASNADNPAVDARRHLRFAAGEENGLDHKP